MELPPVFIEGFIGVITAVWVVNFILSATVMSYTSIPEIHVAFMGAIGLAATAKGLTKKPTRKPEKPT